MNGKEEIPALKEWAISTFVLKDTCSDRHEKQDSKITEISINQAKMQTTLSAITKIDIIILTAVIGLLAAAIGGVILYRDADTPLSRATART